MTVINAMRFNDNEGGMVTDEQGSTTIRKFDSMEKLVVLKRKDIAVLLGGTGTSDILYEATCCLEKTLPQEQCSVSEVTEVLADILVGMKRSRTDRYLRSTFDVSAEEVLSGRKQTKNGVVPIDDRLHRSMFEAFTGQTKNAQERFNNGFVVIGKDAEKTHLYAVVMGDSPSLIQKPTASLGSGFLESEKILAHYVKGLRREQRKDIFFVEGMAQLIHATNVSSEYDVGVGGVPTIAYFRGTDVHLLKEDASRLAAEVVRAHDARFIDDKATYAALEKLLGKNPDIQKIDATVFKKNRDKIMWFLRGYKS